MGFRITWLNMGSALHYWVDISGCLCMWMSFVPLGSYLSDLCGLAWPFGTQVAMYLSFCTCHSHVCACRSLTLFFFCVHAARMVRMCAFFSLWIWSVKVALIALTCLGVRCFWLLHGMSNMVTQVAVLWSSCSLFLLPFLPMLLLLSCSSRCFELCVLCTCGQAIDCVDDTHEPGYGCFYDGVGWLQAILPWSLKKAPALLWE